MKKSFILIGLLAAVFLLYNCNPSRRAAKKIPKTMYEDQLQLVIAANCTPCHFPAKGGNKKPLDNYANVKVNIDDIIHRISLNPTEKGFMPNKKSKLNDSTITVFKKWVADGLLEK